MDNMNEIIGVRNGCYYPRFVGNNNDYSLQTMLHSNNVARIARDIAKDLNFNISEQEQLYEIALYHDIGKAYIPSDILFKPDKLTDEEFNIMKLHTVYSEEIYREIMKYDKLQDIELNAEIIRSHHENFDGTGYPFELRGEDIHIFARIIAIADRFEAITHPRVYRNFPVENPLETIKEMAETNKLDGNLINIKVLEEHLKWK